ncbi:MAG: PKD domain-containing protein [Gammaproteobacteria bacterium]
MNMKIALIAAFLVVLHGVTVAQAQTCNGVAATIVGTAMDDDLEGTSGDDVIVGLGGNDRIDGREGADIICGNDGDDDLLGGSGDDQLFGDAGNDVLEGGADIDSCDGVVGIDSASDDCETRANIDTQVERVTLLANDRTPLDGALYIPIDDAAPQGTRSVAMIVSHGAMGSFDSSVPKIIGLQASPLGFTVLALNRRDWGSDGGGGAVLFEDTTRDVGVGIDFLSELGYDAIFVAGHSQGTQNAAIYPSFTMDERVVAVGLYGTVDDGRGTARDLLFRFTYDDDVIRARDLVNRGEGDVIVGWPTVFGVDLDRSPNNFLSFWGPDTLSIVEREIAKLEIPALLLRADGDEFTPDAMSLNVIATANAAGVDATYVVLDYPFPLSDNGGNAHGFVGVERELMATTLDWLTAKVPEVSAVTADTKLAPQNNNPPGNFVPFAKVLGGSTVVAGSTIALDASGSFDLDGTIVGFDWQQVSGTQANIAGSSTARVVFEAPAPSRAAPALFNSQDDSVFRETLAFDVTVTDDAGGTDTSRVEVVVLDENFAVASGSSLAPLTTLLLSWIAGMMCLSRRRSRQRASHRH